MAEDDSSRGTKRPCGSPLPPSEEPPKKILRQKSPEEEQSATASGISSAVPSGPPTSDGVKDVCRVKRKLWEVDSEQVHDDIHKELKKLRRDESLTKSARWNFDFEREKPLSGDWHWQKASFVPKFYKHKVAHSSKSVPANTSRRSFMSGVICTVQIPVPISSPSVTTRSSSASSATVPSASTSSRPWTRSQISKSLPTSPVSGTAGAGSSSKQPPRSRRTRSAPALCKAASTRKRRHRSALLKNFR